MASPAVVQPTEEQKILQTIQISTKAASDIATVWGHATLSSLIGEVPALAPVMVGFLDAILASVKAKKS